MNIERGGSIYEVIDENDLEYQVQFPFRTACDDGTTKVEMFKLWWYKKYCNTVKGEYSI